MMTVYEAQKTQRIWRKIIDEMDNGKNKKRLMERRNRLQKAIWDAVPDVEKVSMRKQVFDLASKLKKEGVIE